MDRGEERIADAGVCDVLRGQARRVHRRALMMALIVTAVALVLP